MKIHVVATAALIAVLGASGLAQQPASNAAPSPAVKLQVVVSRYQSDKKTTSLPYTLTATMDDRSHVGRANLRLGTQVPITTMSKQSGDPNAPLVPTVQYRDVGTNIDAIVTGGEEGKYKVDLTVEDSSIDGAPGSGPVAANPAFRSFRVSNSLMLRDGMTTQYTTATDKVSGDIWKVDVTLTVVK